MKALSKKAYRIIVVLAAVCLAVTGFAVWYQNRGFFHEGDEAKVHAYLHKQVDFHSDIAPVYVPGRRGEDKWKAFLKNTQSGKKDYIIIAEYTIEGDGIYTYISYKDGRYYVVRDNSDDMWRGGTYSGEYVYTNLTDLYYSDYDWSDFDKKAWIRHIHSAWLSDDPDFDPNDREGVRCAELFGIVESWEELPLEDIP